LVEAIASGGEAFASVRDRLAAVEERAADLELARFSARAAQLPTTIPVAQVMAYLRGLRRMVKTDVAKAKTALAGMLDGDLVLTPATGDQPAQVTGRIAPTGLLGVPLCIAGARFVNRTPVQRGVGDRHGTHRFCGRIAGGAAYPLTRAVAGRDGPETARFGGCLGPFRTGVLGVSRGRCPGGRPGRVLGARPGGRH
jgi:hypothetical protein